MDVRIIAFTYICDREIQNLDFSYFCQDSIKVELSHYLVVEQQVESEIQQRLSIESKNKNLDHVLVTTKEKFLDLINSIEADNQIIYLMFLNRNEKLLEIEFENLLQALEKNHDLVTFDFLIDDGNTTLWRRIPKWSPIRLMGKNYYENHYLINLKFFQSIGGVSKGEMPATHHELLLKSCELKPKVNHLPQAFVKKFEEENKDPECDSFLGKNARTSMSLLQNVASRLKMSVKIEECGQNQSHFKFLFEGSRKPVSIVIPTAFMFDKSGITPALISAVKSILLELDEDDEIVIVSGNEENHNSLQSISNLTKAKMVHLIDKSKFSFSRRVNLGAENCKNENIIFLNDDVEFLTKNVINQLSGWLSLESVGIVGCQLLDDKGRIQHIGHSYNYGQAEHYQYRDAVDNLVDGVGVLDHEVSGVTGAVLMTTKSIWKSVGGFSLKFPNNFNDVDFCLKVRSIGFEIIVANSVVGIHEESTTRESTVEDWEFDRLRSRWEFMMAMDEYLPKLNEYNGFWQIETKKEP